MFDIDQYEDAPTADITLKNPKTGAPLDITMTLAGPEHPVRKQLAFDTQRRLRANWQKTGKLQMQDPVEDEQDETDMLVASTLGWSGIARRGQPLAFSAAAARELYTDPQRRWLRTQVLAALNEREAFIKRSETA